MKLVVFDLDGTLLHTLVDLTNAVNVGLVAEGLPTVTVPQLRRMVGNGAEQLIARASGIEDGEQYKRIFDLYSSHYHDHYADNTYPYDGVEDMLASLVQAGIAIGVFSNKNDRAVKLLCDKHFADSVQWAVGRQRGGIAKPDPFGLLDIMQQCGADSSNTLFVGDSIVDIATASNGNVPCICVDWGYNDVSQLTNGGATQIASSTDELLQMILGM